MDNKDIRWKQRFQNFEKALRQLKRAVLTPSPSELERAGIIQMYEFTFELAWKTLKDYLKAKEVVANFPTEVIREAFAYGLLQDGEVWMDMMEKHNLLVHTYNETNAELAYRLITEQYYNELEKVYQTLKAAL